MTSVNVARGFTLLELMIVVVIIAILSAIALPNYLKYLQRTRRSDAQASLMNAAQAEEKYYGRCNTYGSLAQIYGSAAPTCAFALDSTPSTQGYYTIALTAITATTYTLTATPVAGGPQNADQCGTLSLTSTGIKGTTGDPNFAIDGDIYRCWH